MTDFTPLTSLIGGALIGLSAVLLMLLEGRIAGISTIASRLLPPWGDAALPSRTGFVAGLVLAPILYAMLAGEVVQSVSADLPMMAAAGLLVGFGAVLGGGCTSGHGVCGMARLSRRSFVATGIFMAVAIATVFVVRHVIGG